MKQEDSSRTPFHRTSLPAGVALCLVCLLAMCQPSAWATATNVQSTGSHPHPHLYIDSAGVAELKAAIGSTHSLIWTQVVSWADQQLSAPTPEVLEGDFRRIGERIPYVAICHLLTGEKRYSECAINTMLAITACEHWGNNRDIEAAHLLYGLALGYDWLYDALSPSQRESIRNKITLQGMRLHASCGRVQPLLNNHHFVELVALGAASFAHMPGPLLSNWNAFCTSLEELCESVHPPLNNHTVVKLSALGIAAMALAPDAPSSEWTSFVNREFEKAMQYFGEDGMSCEGISYWSYSVEYMLKYFAAADPILGTDFLSHPWIHNAADMPLYFALPRESWTSANMFINVADSPRFCWYGPHYQLYKLAALTSRPEVQWLANEIQNSGFTRHHADWLALLWYEPELPSSPPDALPLTKHFTDWDLAVMRSGWAADATVLTFRCSPIGGHQLAGIRRPAYPGSGHCHPDANSFTLFTEREWIVPDAGATLTKHTSNHNTMLVDGAGQQGEGARWLNSELQLRNECNPRFVHSQSAPLFDYFVGDASRLYREEAGLSKFLRHFIYVRPNTIVIVDELKSEQPTTFEWLLHSPGNIAIEPDAHAQLHINEACIGVKWSGSSPLTPTTETMTVEAEYPNEDWRALNTLSLKSGRTNRMWIATVMATSKETMKQVALAEPVPGELSITVQTETEPMHLSLVGIGTPRSSVSILEPPER
ncbi:MAG: DUF4962 domain-containing protein [Verrucomicrobia bacterium]|nr:DUF4962 domain-containing protein [Verrucomicrobiota bacterium]